MRDSEDAPPTNPRELYEQLPFKAKDYGYIRDAQAQILTKWDDKRSQRDIVIKVNTGGGKTIDGLIILQSYLNEGIRPALYVAPNNFLVEQVVKEAGNLGISVVTDPETPAYLAGEAIAVVNGAKLFNGRTVFSDNRPSAPRVPIGAVVIDDAHAVLATLKDQLSVTIASSNPAFKELLDLFEEDLKRQAPDVLLDIQEKVGGGFARVPFWALSNKLDQARAILRRYKPDNEFDFGADAIRDSLGICRIVFTRLALTIVPPVPPVGRVHSFANAQRRVFLTATLANDSALITDFDADPVLVSEPIQPLTAGDIGERMILAPQEINPSITADEVRAEIAKLSKTHNVLVIVPSDKAMETWRQHSPTIATKNNLTKVIAAMRSKEHVGLVVTANKYDGIDLPDDACRVLVIDGLPQAFSGDERLESLMQLGIGGVDDRQVQRLEQGMGRAVRSNEDHCVVFLIGRRLAQLTVDPRTLERFSPATQAQLKASRVMAKNMDNQPLRKIMETAAQSLTRDPSWVKYAKSRLRSLVPSPARVENSAVEMRRAFDSANAGDLEGGASRLTAAAEACDDQRKAGQLLEQAAAYAERYNPTQAQSLLALARSRNLYVLRPLTGIAYRPLTFAGSQAAKVAHRAAAMFGTPQAMRVEVEGILDRLQFDPTATEEFEEAVLELGLFLGLGSQRPERELGQGPDNLWAIDSGQFWVIEIKSGAVSEFISKRDAGQLGEAMQWFGGKYPADQAATPVMIHRERKLHKTASGPSEMRVLNARGLGELTTDVRALAEGLAISGWSDLSNVARLLNGHRLDAAGLVNRLVAPTGGTA
nr:helicase C-terminal domain-containing protein [Leucobacter sp. cx-169]